MTELSPTPRTTLTREEERGVSDRAELLALLREGVIAHIGVTVGDDEGSHPVVLPVAYAVDPDGPNRDGTLYVHGSVAAGIVASPVVPDPEAPGPVPEHVLRRAADFA